MNRDQLNDWLHCLEGGMYDWVADEIKKELAQPLPQPVCDKDPSLCGFTLCQLAKVCKHTPRNTMPTKIVGPNLEQILNAAGFYRQPEQEPVAWYAKDNLEINDEVEVIWNSEMPKYAQVWIPLYTAPLKSEQDWSLLIATQDLLREHMARIKELELNIRDQTALHLLYKGDYEDLFAKSKREWVGLTEDEVEQLENTVLTRKQAIKMIEHYLKVKNT